jgi:hypothetical protein
MALSKSESIVKIMVIMPTGEAGALSDPSVIVESELIIDDPDDDTLPLRQTRLKDINKWVMAVVEGEDDVLTDFSGETQLVQDICAAVWADA